MPKPFASSFTLIAAFAAAGAQSAQARFDDVFASRKPPSVHYEAHFLARGGEQTLDAWRDGGTRVKRRTNDDVETYAARRPGEAEYAMTVLDLKRKLLTRIDRANLSRIGNFTDWFDLAHGLRHPRGEYTLAAAPAPAEAPHVVGPCSWFDLEQQGRTSHVCWSKRVQLPLAIVDREGRVVWRITKLETGRIAPEVFHIDARDYVVNNANEDIQRD